MSEIEIGRLLRSSTQECVVGCRVSSISVPSFGGLVRIPVVGEPEVSIYGLITDIRIEDDGLVRQLVTSENVSQDVILDNRMNRNVPVEISVLFIGYEQDGVVYHLLPARPPLALDLMYQCTQDELTRFTGQERFGYFRHLLNASDIPIADVLASHLRQAAEVHMAVGNEVWVEAATRELITLLRDEYSELMSVLGALSDARLFYPEN